MASAEFGDTAQGSVHGCKSGGLGRWSGWEIGAMVAGFVVFWPLGLLAIFAKWKFGQLWKGSAQGAAPWGGLTLPDISSWGWQGVGSAAMGSGNAAFDAYKREQLRRLEEEKRRLDVEQREFRAFVERLRRAKDQDEFDRFMAERAARPAGKSDL
ncbi:DUF2852 domain-containing protein [Aestuariivirga sp.]|uniref:DUF2852 domain-containing protein n=1 Tax=Aestuariivirga sp. TaxID=2650926 RepID=UPI003784D08B